MLTILFGTSCVGKTTLINGLYSRFSLPYIGCYTTRPARDNDIGRYQVSDEEFDVLEKEQKFLLVNRNFKYRYGTPRDQIMLAVNSLDNFVIDFLIKDLSSFNSIKCKKIIVVPENEDQLEYQISQSIERIDRREEILSDYRNNFSTSKIEQYDRQGCFIFTNYFQRIKNNTFELHNLILKQHGFIG